MKSNDLLAELLKGMPESYREAMRETAKVKPSGDVVKGYDFNKGLDYEKLLASYTTCGIQATNLAKAVEEINKMIKWRPSDEPIGENEEEGLKSEEKRKEVRCTIFLGYTSNMISCGVREIIRYLCEHKMVDCIVTTTGGIEEDIMKCMNDTYIGDFKLKGEELRKQRLNRTGNMIVPNDNYNSFEDWAFPIEEQISKGTIFTLSMIIDRFGKEINNPESVYYWYHKNKIPVFCPALTNGAIGDVLYLYLEKHKDFIINITADIYKIDNVARYAKKSGVSYLVAVSSNTTSATPI
jgi:deoxyhypusine synthase